MKHVAIIGASLAGLSAARALRSQGFGGRVTVVGDETRRPYDRPPLSKEFLAGDMTEADLALEADDDDLQAEWLFGVAATKLDTCFWRSRTRRRNPGSRRWRRNRDRVSGAPLAPLRNHGGRPRHPYH